MAKNPNVKPAFYGITDMITLFCRSRSWVLLQSKTEDFPRPVKLGGCLAWHRAEVDCFINALPAAEGCGLDAVAAQQVKSQQAHAGA